MGANQVYMHMPTQVCPTLMGANQVYMHMPTQVCPINILSDHPVAGHVGCNMLA